MESAIAGSALVVDVVSDVVCPWCFIGKRKLERALSSLRTAEPALDVTTRWHAFQLNPDLPAEGIPRRDYLARKFGARSADIYQRVQTVGAEVGIAFAFDRIERQPNTLDAHRLVMWAQAGGDAAPLVEALFAAYFIDGRAIGAREVLADIAHETGLEREEVLAFLVSDALVDATCAEDREAREVGVEGVPFFIFNGTIAVSGAHEPKMLLEAIAAARTAP
jgi:predicted DsbA family dithiol-disulfide isomerase